MSTPLDSASSPPMSQPAAPTSTATAQDAFDTPRFNRLLALMEKQERRGIQCLRATSHTITFIIDDLPYDEEEDPIDSEQLWSGVYEIASAKMKEEAEEWKGLMDVSLVFIAIFLTVLTAFLVPAAQALSPSPSDTQSNSTSPLPPLPPRSDQNVCAFYYLSLIMAMCNAVLCVLGRRWVGRLLSRPNGKTHRERTMRHEARKKLAYSWIKPLVAVLYWSLLLSIGLFVSGLLYQLRNLSNSFDQPASILETTWGLGILLAALIVATVAATTVHALRFESSPFEGVLSKILVGILHRFGERWKLIKNWRVGVEWESERDAFKTSMELIAEANDPKLLDRVAPSFSYFAWICYDEGSIETLARAHDRLVASDTSTRVRETVGAQISRFANLCRRYPWLVEDRPRNKINEIDQFIRTRGPFPSCFPGWATIVSFRENNEDLLEIGSLPAHECVAQLLCTYDQNGALGDRVGIFEAAVDHCDRLVFVGDEEDVLQILSNVDPLSFARSFMRAPETVAFDDHSFFLPFLVRERQTEILLHMNEFLKDPPSNLNHVHVSAILCAVLSPDSPLPLHIDISPIIAFVTHHPHGRFWTKISASLVLYLAECEISELSDPNVAFAFLCHCIDINSFVLETSDDTRSRAQSILNTHFLPNITPLPPSRSPSTSPSSPQPAHLAPSSEDLNDSQPHGSFRRRRSSASVIHIG
ncbi:hypothetical protein SISNIDRAFT_483821 [Sistotremastrum niveocremeum HHB9708]|uniref:DUF6535 domain-containing protein n=1 Tax=Sistotremastrum niveocremeum HHB9708 TaxID=1314777 RepID=A0A164X3D3_9AGAM|nr:hypothetical protein SISNIDRAFT_483821 [Sistotremastrum niveocremeum HHB9708]